jgi:hypothetical protein
LLVKQTSPADRDRAQRRVRSITMASAAGAGVLTLVGAAVTAGTFAGRTVGTAQSTQTTPTQDPSGGLQQPVQPPGDGSSLGDPNAGLGNAPVVSGGS